MRPSGAHTMVPRFFSFVAAASRGPESQNMAALSARVVANSRNRRPAHPASGVMPFLSQMRTLEQHDALARLTAGTPGTHRMRRHERPITGLAWIFLGGFGWSALSIAGQPENAAPPPMQSPSPPVA